MKTNEWQYEKQIICLVYFQRCPRRDRELNQCLADHLDLSNGLRVVDPARLAVLRQVFFRSFERDLDWERVFGINGKSVLEERNIAPRGFC